MSARGGKRAAYWFGKRDAGRPFSRAGNDAAGRDGRVSMGRRWFSDEWWKGHHKDRDASGQWEDGQGGRARKAWGQSTYQRTHKPEGYAARVRSNRAAYRDYLAEREDAATKATNGYMLTKAGKARGYDGGSFFDPNASRRPGRRYMSDELRSWMGDSDSPAERGGGGVLSFNRWSHLTQAKRAA